MAPVRVKGSVSTVTDGTQGDTHLRGLSPSSLSSTHLGETFATSALHNAEMTPEGNLILRALACAL